jgi:hypothetical protein
MFRFIAVSAAIVVGLLWLDVGVAHGRVLSDDCGVDCGADCGATAVTPDASGRVRRSPNGGRLGGEVSQRDAPGKGSAVTDHRAQPPPAQFAR